jgi:hypothetical protein
MIKLFFQDGGCKHHLLESYLDTNYQQGEKPFQKFVQSIYAIQPKQVYTLKKPLIKPCSRCL